MRLLHPLGLDAITAAHGVLSAVLIATIHILDLQSPTAATIFAGLISTQVCLATAWAAWSAEPFPIRCSRLAWRMTWLYLLLLFIASLAGNRQTAMLWSLAATIGPFILTTWLPSAILRWFALRLVKVAGPQQAPPRLQFHLADVWRWLTLLCVLLAVMATFRKEVTGWDGLGYAIMLYFGVMACAPAGLTVSALLWLALGERWNMPRRIVAGILTTAWIIISALAAFYGLDSVENDNDVWSGVWGLATVICLVTLLTAAVLRHQGWRLTRRDAAS
jgi:hypothetical protein